MNRHSFYMGGTVVLALAASALGRGVSVGQAAPAINAGAWFNTPGSSTVSAEDLKGSVVMLEFFATW